MQTLPYKKTRRKLIEKAIYLTGQLGKTEKENPGIDYYKWLHTSATRNLFFLSIINC